MSSPGWHPDPRAPNDRERWWDGEQWGTDSPTRPTGTPGQQPPREPGVKGWWNRLSTNAKVGLVAGVAVLLVLGAVFGEEEPDGSAGQQQADESAESDPTPEGDEEAAEKEDCTDRATTDCTPRVGAEESVRVDALTWEVTDVTTQATIGDQEFGLGEEANGVYVIADLDVTSDRDESVTLTDGIVSLVVGDRTYEPDNSGTVAAIGAGDDPLFLEDIGPDSTLSSRVVFDVPEAVLDEDPELRFGELGFGSTEGFIALPALE